MDSLAFYGDLKDPEFVPKAKAYLLKLYQTKWAQHLTSSAQPQTEVKTDSGQTIHLGLDNLPAEHLPSDQFRYLLQVRHDIDTILSAPGEEVTDGLLGAAIMLQRGLLYFAYRFADRLLTFLLLDTRFHPEYERNIDATVLLGLGSDEATQAKHSSELTSFANILCLYNLLNLQLAPNIHFAQEFQLLHTCGDIFFDTVQDIFPLPSVNKCRRAFIQLMTELGKSHAEEQVANYIRRRKTMYLDIVKWTKQGGKIGADESERALNAQGLEIQKLTDTLKSIQEDLQKNTRTIANMDRRQKTLFEFIKDTIIKLIKFIKPRAEIRRASNEELKAFVAPAKHYDCLKNIKEPHRSQILTVIQYTKDHPIVHKAKNRDQFALANAVRVVWNEKGEEWTKHIPDSYPSFEALKAACYGLQADPERDPFYYQR